MFRPQSFSGPGRGSRSGATATAFSLLLPGFVLALQAAPPALALPPDEPVRVYTDEDLKPKRPPKPEEIGLPSGPLYMPSAPAVPQTRPQTQPAAGQAPAAAPSEAPGAPRPAAPPASPPAQSQPAATPAPQKPDTPDPPPRERWAEEWKREEEERTRQEEAIRDAEDEIARLERRIDYLERKKASIQNPFLPRPLLTEEDRQAEEGLDGPARLARTDGQIAEARLQLEKARRALEKARVLAGTGGSPSQATGQSNQTY